MQSNNNPHYHNLYTGELLERSKQDLAETLQSVAFLEARLLP